MCFKTVIGIIDDGEVPKVETVCRDIAKKDETFKYRIAKPRNKELKEKFVAVLIIMSNSEKEANARGGWFIHKMKDAKVSDYFWVKKCSRGKKDEKH